MKIKVTAIAPYDGWVFIVREEKMYLLRPPYVLSRLEEVSRFEVENAISTHGFEECDITFDSIDEVIEFLKDQFVTLRKSHGIEIPSSKELRKLLEYASDDVLLEYLRKTEEELISRRKFEVAESIVSDLMKLEKVRDSPDLKRMATRIIEKCEEARKQSPGKYMDEQFIQEVKKSTRKIVKENFPEEEEYFDFLFDLTIQEIQELEPGKETEFLREMRAVHPELVLGFTPIIIILTVQILGDFTHGNLITEDIIKKRIESISESKEILGLSKYFAQYRDKEREREKGKEEKK